MRCALSAALLVATLGVPAAAQTAVSPAVALPRTNAPVAKPFGPANVAVPAQPNPAERLSTVKALTGQSAKLGTTRHVAVAMAGSGDRILASNVAWYTSKVNVLSMRGDGKVMVDLTTANGLSTGLHLVQCGAKVSYGTGGLVWSVSPAGGLPDVTGVPTVTGDIASFVVDLTNSKNAFYLAAPGKEWSFSYCDVTPIG